MSLRFENRVWLSLTLSRLATARDIYECGGFMAGNSRPSFSKRQKERARQEKRAEKLQKRVERKAQRDQSPQDRTEKTQIEYDEYGQPKPLDFHDF
jgi:hypothetical protein